MITLADIFGQLSTGELYQVASGGQDLDRCGEGTLGIKLENYPMLIRHINLGLISLYTQFPVREGEVAIALYPSITRYELNSKYSVTSKDDTILYKYIMDTPKCPFKDNVLRIEQIFNSCGNVVPINDEAYCQSVFTPAYNEIQVPNPVEGEVLFVSYREAPVAIPTDTTDLTTKVDIPAVLVEPLLFYVASRYNAGKPTGLDASNLFLSRYYTRISEIAARNVFGNDYSTTSTALERNGWV